MIKHSFLLTILVLLFNVGYAQTPINGGTVSGTWTQAGSPYLINGSIMVPNGSTLTIQPGVTINFQGPHKILVLGRILAVGTVADTIVFTATNTTTGWKGIRFDNTPAANDTSKIAYCRLQYGKATGTPPEDNGGALYIKNFAKVIISNCRIANCTASYGGGIYSESSDLIIRNNKIANNMSSVSDGGGIFCSGNPTITGNTISNNTSNANAGGIYCDSNGHLVLKNNIITNNNAFNVANNTGGGIYCNGGPSVISNNTISNNKASSGGGIYCSPYCIATISNNIVSGNSNDGIYCHSSFNPSIINNTISNNKGVGIICNSNSGNNEGPLISNNTITGSTASGINCRGGGTGGSGRMTVSANIISGNSGLQAGGISASGTNISIVNNTIFNNTSIGGLGGGILCSGDSSLVISNNTITDNVVLVPNANVNPSGGGGIFCSGTPKIFSNVISNNSTSCLNDNCGGGGIYCFKGNPAIFNNIISNNSALAGIGGGIRVYYQSNPVFTNNTIVNNAASGQGAKGGALSFYYKCNPVFRNCIIYGNTAPVYNTVFIEDESSDPDFYYCNVEGGITAFGLNDNFYTGKYENNSDADPLFVSPSGGSGVDFNGTTADWSLQESSPFIDGGDPNGTYSETDIAGQPRVSGPGIDIGAYEYYIIVGIEENKQRSLIINVYPNPFSTQTTLQTDAGFKNTMLTIYNADGQIVKQIEKISGQAVIFDRENLPNGLYLVSLTQGSKILATKKLILTR